MFKKALYRIWNWIWSKTNVDEKTIEVIDEIHIRSILVKKELKDVAVAVKSVPVKPKKKYYKPKAELKK